MLSYKELREESFDSLLQVFALNVITCIHFTPLCPGLAEWLLLYKNMYNGNSVPIQEVNSGEKNVCKSIIYIYKNSGDDREPTGRRFKATLAPNLI